MPLPCCTEKFATIPEDEPVLIIRGKDLLAPETIAFWMSKAREKGVNQAKLDAVRVHLDAVLDFQDAHPERCKIPD